MPWGCFLPTPIQVLGARCPQSPLPLSRCWVCPCHRLLPETGLFGGSSSGSVPCESSAEEPGSGGCVVCAGGAHTKASPEEMSKPRATKHPLPQTLSCFCKNLCAGPGCSAAETQEKNPKRGHEGKGARGLGPAGAAGRAGAGRGPRPTGVRTPPAGLCSPTAPSWPLPPRRGAEARWGGLHWVTPSSPWIQAGGIYPTSAFLPAPAPAPFHVPRLPTLSCALSSPVEKCPPPGSPVGPCPPLQCPGLGQGRISAENPKDSALPHGPWGKGSGEFLPPFFAEAGAVPSEGSGAGCALGDTALGTRGVALPSGGAGVAVYLGARELVEPFGGTRDTFQLPSALGDGLALGGCRGWLRFGTHRRWPHNGALRGWLHLLGGPWAASPSLVAAWGWGQGWGWGRCSQAAARGGRGQLPAPCRATPCCAVPCCAVGWGLGQVLQGLRRSPTRPWFLRPLRLGVAMGSRGGSGSWQPPPRCVGSGGCLSKAPPGPPARLPGRAHPQLPAPPVPRFSCKLQPCVLAALCPGCVHPLAPQLHRALVGGGHPSQGVPAGAPGGSREPPAELQGQSCRGAEAGGWRQLRGERGAGPVGVPHPRVAPPKPQGPNPGEPSPA